MFLSVNIIEPTSWKHFLTSFDIFLWGVLWETSGCQYVKLNCIDFNGDNNSRVDGFLLTTSINVTRSYRKKLFKVHISRLSRHCSSLKAERARKPSFLASRQQMSRLSSTKSQSSSIPRGMFPSSLRKIVISLWKNGGSPS